MSCDRLSAASAGLAFELLLRLAQIRILTTTREHSSALVGQPASSRCVATAGAAQYRLTCGCRNQRRAPLSLVRPRQPTGTLFQTSVPLPPSPGLQPYWHSLLLTANFEFSELCWSIGDSNPDPLPARQGRNAFWRVQRLILRLTGSTLYASRVRVLSG
jgi:hypothetical protein